MIPAQKWARLCICCSLVHWRVNYQWTSVQHLHQVCRGAVGRSVLARFVKLTFLANCMRTGVAVVAVLLTFLAGKVPQGDAW